MKKTLIYASFALTLLAAGCKKEEPTDDTQKTPVNLEIEKDVTRTVTNGSTTQFVEGDVIGITSSGLDEDMNNAQFTVTADGRLTGEVFYYDGSNGATFFAHYPYSAEVKDGAVNMTVEADQTTEERYNASDFMTAVATGDPKYGGVVSLKMHHRLTLVKIIWNGSLYASDATLHNVIRNVSWVHADNSLVLGGSLSDILTWKVSAEKQEYWAVIPAQTIAQGSDLITIVDANMEYKYVTERDVTFNPNTIKKITLDTKANGAVTAVFSELEIDEWEADDVICEGTVDEYEGPAIELISEEAGKNITLLYDKKKNTAEAGRWNVANNNEKTDENPDGNVIETITEDEQTVLHMNIKSNMVETVKKNDDGSTTTEMKEMSSWWDNAVYFRPDARTAAKIRPVLYKLTFDVKASEVGKGFMVQVMKGDENGNIYFGITNADPTVKDNVTYNRMYYPVLKTADEYSTMSFWVDFSKIVSTDGKTITEGLVGDYENVLLTLSINTGTTEANAFGVDFYFKNFKFIQVK